MEATTLAISSPLMRWRPASARIAASAAAQLGLSLGHPAGDDLRVSAGLKHGRVFAQLGLAVGDLAPGLLASSIGRAAALGLLEITNGLL